MFSGIVETTSKVLVFAPRSHVYELITARPATFDDIKVGDSVAINGICLTVEKFDSETMGFAVADETLKVMKGAAFFEKGRFVNLERSLRLNDRIHGHIVQGHVDAMVEVIIADRKEEGLLLRVRFSESMKPYFWHKGSVTLNGVSLTINSVIGNELEVFLIPETIKRTNLAEVKVGDLLTCEADSLARYYNRMRELEGELNT